jgi:hypothetical protein
MLVFSMGMLVTTCKIQRTYLGFSCHNISTTPKEGEPIILQIFGCGYIECITSYIWIIEKYVW